MYLSLDNTDEAHKYGTKSGSNMETVMFTILCGHVREVSTFNKFFPIVDTCLSCKDTARKKFCDGAKMTIFCVLYFQRAACSTFQTCILNSY